MLPSRRNQDAADPRAVPTERHKVGVIPWITTEEITYALDKMKRNKASVEDGVHVEMMQTSVELELAVLVKLFNSVLQQNNKVASDSLKT